ncbi:MAG: hypothetical protein JXR53_14525 [Bacteroidales bacterium]|nr:hypothetical protein [Bacteroidales bacterium]
MKSMTKILLSTFVLLIAFSGAFAQDAIEFPDPCSISGPKYGEDSATAVKNLSLYRENYKQWKKSNYKNDAILYTIEPWRYCFLNAPLASQNIYFDGLNIIEYLMEQTEDSLLKERYIDTLFMVYDQNIAAFGCSKKYGEAYILGRKGYDMFTYRPSDDLAMYETLKRSYDLGGDESEAAVMSIFYKALDMMIRKGKADTSLIFEYYEKLTSSADYQIKAFKQEIIDKPADSASLNRKLSLYLTADGNINSIFDPWASCEQILMIYTPKFDENKEDVEWLAKLLTLMDKKGCTDAPLYFSAAEARYAIEPSPQGAFDLGKSFYKVEKYSDAVKYLKEAVDGLEDPLEKASALLVLANTYKSLGQYSAARTAALQSAELDPTNGRQYILIGDMYMQTAASCGDNPVTQRAGYWAAADKYAKAKSVATEESVIEQANARYSSAFSGFPKNEDMFFYNITNGSSYTVSCWYTEITTARSRD